MAVQPGVLGNAYHAPGTLADFVVLDNTPGNGTEEASLNSDLLFGAGTDYTITCWIDTTNIATTSRVFGDLDWTVTGASREGAGLIRVGGGGFSLRVYQPGNEDQMNFGYSAGWHHLALTVNRTGNTVVYFDGAPVATQATDVLGTVGNAAVPWIFGKIQLTSAA